MNYTSFLEGTTRDFRHRRVTDILRYGSLRLEGMHDYMQLLFPTMEQSRYSDVEPITEDDLMLLRRNEKAKEHVRLMYYKMLSFWKLQGDQYLVWDETAPHRLWNALNSHNQMRMTRVLKSLALLQMTDEYRDFSMRLSAVLDEREHNSRVRISDETAKIWRDNFYAE